MKLSSLDEEIIIDIFSSFTQLANFFFINHVLITLKPLMKVFSLSKFEVNKMIFFVRFIVSEMTTMDAWWRFSKFLFGIYYLDYVWKAIFFCRKKNFTVPKWVLKVWPKVSQIVNTLKFIFTICQIGPKGFIGLP